MAQDAKDRHRNQSYQQALSSINEIINESDFKMELPSPIDADEFEKSSNMDKLNKLLSMLNLLCLKTMQIDDSIINEDTDVGAKVITAQTQADTNAISVAELKYENKILKGLVQKQSKQIDSLNSKVIQLTARSMENNLIVTGIIGDTKKENCKQKVIEFIKNKVEVDVCDTEVLVAHRKGKEAEGLDRPMLVRCTIPLRDRLLHNSKNLKDKVNENGDKYFINRQLPETMVEEQQAMRQAIRDQKLLDQNLPTSEKSKITVMQ